MPQGVKEQLVGEPNTEAVNFRVPKGMKKDFIMICDYERYSSVGELFRTLYRTHAQAVLNSQGFKIWLRQKEQDEKARKEAEAAKRQGRLSSVQSVG